MRKGIDELADKAGGHKKIILFCAVIGFLLGLVFGVIYAVQGIKDIPGDYSWLPFISPFAGALFLIGILYGTDAITNNKTGIAKRIIGTLGRGAWGVGKKGCLGIILGQWVAVLVLIIMAVVVFYFVMGLLVAAFLILGWINAGKKLFNNEYAREKPEKRITTYSDDSWDDDISDTPTPMFTPSSKREVPKSDSDWDDDTPITTSKTEKSAKKETSIPLSSDSKIVRVEALDGQKYKLAYETGRTQIVPLIYINAHKELKSLIKEPW